MFWRNAPASTELEQVVVGWLRKMLGLPDAFDGMLTDTASVSSLLALVAARHARGSDGGREACFYASEEAHSSIEKAGIVIGVGRAGLRRVPTDGAYRMRVDALEAAIAADRAAGRAPFCVVATLGTTSSTSVDPVGAIADVCARERLWLHVDAAYAGTAAIAPEFRAGFGGWERADSIVVNPHKWMFTPFDASLLLFRDARQFRDAFSIVPEYLRTPMDPVVRNYNELGVQLGRRFRALKLWFLIRYFGTDGIAARLREHCRLARELASWVEADPDWELTAPVPFSTVCFRHVRADNAAILDAVNRSGRVYLSHTSLAGRYTLRVSIGNPRTTIEHLRTCWSLLRSAS
jgi:aromatic-L-amino-acid decarboxylase